MNSHKLSTFNNSASHGFHGFTMLPASGISFVIRGSGVQAPPPAPQIRSLTINSKSEGRNGGTVGSVGARPDGTENHRSGLRKYGFELVSVAEPDLMATDPTRIRVRQMMGAVAQYEKSQIVLKLRGARLRKRVKEGRCEGRKPFGFDEGEAAALERAKTLRAEGPGFDRIAVRLNDEHFPTRTGRPWRGVVINRILTGTGRA
jgi:hypothetical protein